MLSLLFCLSLVRAEGLHVLTARGDRAWQALMNKTYAHFFDSERNGTRGYPPRIMLVTEPIEGSRPLRYIEIEVRREAARIGRVIVEPEHVWFMPEYSEDHRVELDASVMRELKRMVVGHAGAKPSGRLIFHTLSSDDVIEHDLSPAALKELVRDLSPSRVRRLRQRCTAWLNDRLKIGL